MTLTRIKIAALAFAATVLGVGAAQAQYYSSVQAAPQPLYPYERQGRAPSQPYAVQVAPGAYVIHRPGEENVRPARRVHRAAPAPTPQPKASTVNTTRVVYRKPKVVETKRYVDLPPRVVERYTVVDDSKGDSKVIVEPPSGDAQGVVRKGKPDKGEKRVIQADAEITILGPDRMTIQLYRKGALGKPGARLN